MKKAKQRDELRPEYRLSDLKKGVRGKYYKRYLKGTNLVLLSPDVASAFPTEAAVNNALRSLLKTKASRSNPSSEKRPTRRRAA
jgi:hypothetical protein